MGDLELAVSRLVHNLAVGKSLSRDRAIFAIECALNDLKRKAPTPPEPTAIDVAA